MWSACSLALAAWFVAHAAESPASVSAAWVPGGPPFAGDETEVLLWSPGWLDRPPAEFPRPEKGVVVGVTSLDAAGVAHLRWRAPAEPGGVRVVGPGGFSSVVDVRPRPPATLTPTDTRDAVAWASSVEVFFASPDPPTPEELAVAASEGRVLSVRQTPTGVVVAVAPGPERAARVLAVGLIDLRTPGQTPAWAIVRLRAHHGGTVSAEPGARLTVTIGGRGYGPFVADETGMASLSFDALPGEASYELVVADDLGNSQRLMNPVPSMVRPAMVALPQLRGDGLWLAAWDQRGTPWSEEAPSCRSGSGGTPAHSIGRGRWMWNAPEAGDLPAVCTLADASASARLAAPATLPASIDLRVYPEVLTADFPLAEVQATLLDGRGERLPPEAIVLSAGLGRITPRPAPGALRADYDGSAASSAGSDEIRATWRRPAGSGAPAVVELCLGAEGNSAVAAARVLDLKLSPLADVPVQLDALDRSTASAVALTDARGYARFPLDRVPLRLRATAGLAIGEAASLGGRGVDAACLRGASATGADLAATVNLPIRAGRVRQVFLETEPRVLSLGPGAQALVRVRMLDASGALVRDERVTVTASEGVVSAPTVTADGTAEVVFTPGSSRAARDVKLTATAAGTSVSTTLELVPREVSGAVSVAAGWITGFSTISSPTGTLSLEHRLPFEGLSAALGLGVYNLDTDIEDSEARETVHVSGYFFPVDAGVSLARRGPRLALGAGIGLALVPYVLSVDYGGQETAGGLALSQPGASLRAFVGRRLGEAELFAELRYLLVTTPDGPVSLSGNAGGLSATVGYRLLY